MGGKNSLLHRSTSGTRTDTDGDRVTTRHLLNVDGNRDSHTEVGVTFHKSNESIDFDQSISCKKLRGIKRRVVLIESVRF